MFADTDSRGNPMTRRDAESRRRWEPVMEVTQYKGTSEVHPVLAPTDEFANFELREFLFSGQPATPAPGSYARSALKTGLALESKLGANPYKFGMIGSTDSHSGMVSVEEDNFMGKSGRDALPEQRPEKALGLMSAWEVSASGLAGVWAIENTREGIFDAFMRKEVFATSGPRISLRVYGGFGFRGVVADFDEARLSGGVPMGGDLTAAPKDSPLSLMIEALSDPAGATLDRVQVIKGWQDEGNELHEKIYEVVWGGNRTLSTTGGKLSPITRSRNIPPISYDNDSGAPRFAAVWEDPDFDPDQSSFYYVRVLEIPTPRHHVFDTVALGIDPASSNPGHPALIQERAWSSPIWYTP